MKMINEAKDDVVPPRWRWALWGAMCAGALTSCGGTKLPTEPSTLQPVSGRVTVDGKPAAGLELRLYLLNAPRNAEVPQPHAITDGDGRFQLRTGEHREGAPTGQYLATLIWPAGRGGSDRLGGAFAEPDGSGLTVVIDEKTSELPTFEVSGGRRGRAR